MKFNEVTWYSKLAAIIFFIGILPAWTFYLGMQYQATLEIPPPIQLINTSSKSFVENQTQDYMQMLTCKDSEKYFVVTHPLIDTGEAILVKQKINPSSKFDCIYNVEKNDYELKYETEYFMAIEGDFLITDAGTGPTPRGLQIYNLSSKKQIFQDIYSTPIEIKDGSITYWKPLKENVNEINCPKLNEYTESGLGAGIESHITLNLLNLTEKSLGEKRCSARQ